MPGIVRGGVFRVVGRRAALALLDLAVARGVRLLPLE
jgi:hypothetical protein